MTEIHRRRFIVETENEGVEPVSAGDVQDALVDRLDPNDNDGGVSVDVIEIEFMGRVVVE